MRFSDVFIPFRGYWSTPFCKWQGSLSGQHPIRLAADCARRRLDDLDLHPECLGTLHFGMTVPQPKCFFGAPWLASMIGNDRITGPTIMQACATSARVLASAAGRISLGDRAPALALAADRISNGPHLYFPDPGGPGGTGKSEDWVMDSFNEDPNLHIGMIDTAENIASRFGFSREAQDALTHFRFNQYKRALANDRAFQIGYMIDVKVGGGRTKQVIGTDEGVIPTTREGLAGLAPVREGGSVTYAAQTHPADGNAGMVLCAAEVAVDLAPDGPEIELISYGEGRAEKAYMGMAVVPAAREALHHAGLDIDGVSCVKTHNPFVVNDLYFALETGVDAEKINNFGSSLIFGHPQGPTGLRLVIELIEELAARGGGYGLMAGCAAGDTGAAVVVRVG